MKMMMPVPALSLCVLLLILSMVIAIARATGPEGVAGDQEALRRSARSLMDDGNFAEAYDAFARLLRDPAESENAVFDDLQRATSCLQRLNRLDELDAFLEELLAIHEDSWRARWAVAFGYFHTQHQGRYVAGELLRGEGRGGGKMVNSFERDRARALQIMAEALPAARAAAADPEQSTFVAGFMMQLADILMGYRGYQESWRLQYLTDLSELPDYEDGWYRHSSSLAPVEPDGKTPVYHDLPESFAAARSDGERWRWALAQVAAIAPGRAPEVDLKRAEFLHQQFGVQTMADYGRYFMDDVSQMSDAESDESDESGVWAVHTLKENETIAKLATGIRRFELPEEHDYLRLYRSIARPSSGSSYASTALTALAQIFENRRQYVRAAAEWRECIARFGADQNRQARLEQIIGNWGRFEPGTTQPAGRGADLEYRFRNGRRVDFEAHAIRFERLLTDIKAYIQARPDQIDGSRINIDNIGYRLVNENEDRYRGEKVATWSLELDPRPHHFDRLVTVSTPLSKAGVYLVTARMADGNVSHVIVWLADTVITRSPLSNASHYFLADAVTGEPVAGANVEFFGFKQTRERDRRTYRIDVANFAEKSGATGEVVADPKDQLADSTWLVVARTDSGRLAHLGFDRVWYRGTSDDYPERRLAYTITDRPVYRPGQPVKFKLWLRRPRYRAESEERKLEASFAGQTVTVRIVDPQNATVYEESFTTDDYGGLDGELELDAAATLGVYRFQIPHGSIACQGTFRVEEYKKPEFEVTVEAPKKPLQLGEAFTATIRAKYYFGSPVTEGRVKYKVMRSSLSRAWYPPGRWDWLYGEGYGWFASDYEWYPGWARWGCKRPIFSWYWGSRQDPPELVAEGEVEIGPDGTVAIDIDTAPAAAVHADQDHRYMVTAEVVDASRRTIVGSGSIIAARDPFQVLVWLSRGFTRVGETLEAHVEARTPDRKPVSGEGRVRLLKITYDEENRPVETAVQEWDLDTGPDGRARLQITASQAGQYRLSYVLTDQEGRSREGGYLFNVTGSGFDGSEFRFNALELVPDKREYRPGDTLNLMINSNHAGATVVLFVRPVNGIYPRPRIVRMKGKSTIETVAIEATDQPNVFVEAYTIFDGRIHKDMREIVVPPEERVLDVEVLASQEEYLPGAPATVKVRLTDPEKNPFTGSTVVAIYDKALEYIAGGSNVPDIKSFFWSWKRNHSSRLTCSLLRYLTNMVDPGATGMGDLGVFGGTVAEDQIVTALGSTGIRRGAASPAGAEGLRKSESRSMDASLGADQELLLDFGEGAWGQAPGEPGGELVEAEVRSRFADTALWVGSLTTGPDGTAEVTCTMPENLTAWKVKVWGLGKGTRVGQGETEVVTRKNLILRLQAPRFFVETDEVVLSANVHNYLDTAKIAEVSLELDGQTLQAMGDVRRTVEIPAGGEVRVDWRVRAVVEGEAVVRMKALTDEESDAMEMKLPVNVHGVLKTVAVSGTVRPDQERGTFTVEVPAERRINESRLEVRWSPTLAGAMVDALPYLVSYPYGCTEQTLSRFLPTVITQRVLLSMGLDLATIREKRANLNAQEIGDPAERAAQWKRYEHNPVFDEAEVERMVKEGLKAITGMQLGDGGWGWFSGWGERSAPHTTAYVVHALQIAVENDLALVPGVLDRGVEWLESYQEEQIRRLRNAATETKPFKRHADNLDALVYMVLTDAGKESAAMRDYLYRDRTSLAVYALAMIGLAYEKLGESEKLAMVLRNISQYLVQDDENQTAWLELSNQGYWWYWYGSENEANAYYLKLLARTDPGGETARRLVKYLLNNRKHGGYWRSTRDTAICIEAFAGFLKASGESKPDLAVEVWMDGERRKTVTITPENLFSFDDRFVLFGDAVETGVHTIELRRTGTGPLYYNGYITNFTKEDFITKAGLEVKVERTVYLLREIEDAEAFVPGSRGQAVDQRVLKYERTELVNLATCKSGDLVEVELEIESKNDYEYLVFEDMKAAGFEPVEVRSGYGGNDMGAYTEYRDDRVSFFVRWLARGRHSVSYRLRAEIPGRFSALPALGYAMYAPELRGNSDEIKLRIEDVDGGSVGGGR